MKQAILATAAITVTLLAGAITNVANADSSFDNHRFLRVSSFEGQIAFCDPPAPPVDVVELPGGITITTFVNENNVWVTGNPLVDGVEKNRVVVVFDPSLPPDVPPNNQARVDSSIDVAAFEGGWRIRQRLEFSPEGTTSFGIGFGLGDLRGKLIIINNDTPSRFEVVQDPPCDVPPGYPADQIMGARLQGTVITFGWSG